jgi:hypothetical protein
MRKAEAIKMIPMTDRKIASPLPTFFIITVDPLPSYSISALPQIQNPIPLPSRNGVFDLQTIQPPGHPLGQGLRVDG